MSHTPGIIGSTSGNGGSSSTVIDRTGTMAITDRDRRDLFTKLEATLGEDTADTLMQLLPNEPADQLVTRTDMHALGTGLRGEMAELRAELRGEMAELRAELRGEMAELRGEMTELRSELRGEMTDLRADVQVEISRLDSRITEFVVDIKAHTSRAILGGVVVNVATVLAAVGLT